MLLASLGHVGMVPAAAAVPLATHAIERQLGAGARLTWQDGLAPAAYVVADGRVSLHVGGHVIQRATARDAIAWIETLVRSEGIVELRADTPALLLEIPVATLLAVMEDHFVMTLGLIRRLACALLDTPAWLGRSVARDALAVPDVESSSASDLVDRMLVLSSSRVFARARTDSLAEIAAQFDEVSFASGTALWRQGDAARAVMVVLSGRIRSASCEGLVLEWTPGTVPGFIEALADRPRWHDAVAITPVTVLRLTGERFLDALEDDFGMALDVLASLALEVREQQADRLSESRPGTQA